MWARIFWISCGVPIDLFTTTGVAFVEASALARSTLDVSALAEPTVGACKVDSALVDSIVVVGALVVVVVLAEANQGLWQLIMCLKQGHVMRKRYSCT